MLDDVCECCLGHDERYHLLWYNQQEVVCSCVSLIHTVVPWQSPAIPAEHPPIKPVIRLPSPTGKHNYIEEGYNITRTEAPKDLGGRFRRNCALTTPELPSTRSVNQTAGCHVDGDWSLPCGRVTLPQITLIFDPLISLCAR